MSVPLPFKAVRFIHMPSFISSVFALFLFAFYLIFVKFLPVGKDSRALPFPPCLLFCGKK